MDSGMLMITCLNKLHEIANSQSEDLILNSDAIVIGKLTYYAGTKRLDEDLFDAVLFFVKNLESK